MNSLRFASFFKKEKALYLSGKSVNDLQYKDFIDQLKSYNLASLKTDQLKKAFWINIYNGLTNYQIIKKQITQSMKEDNQFFKSPIAIIDNEQFSLDDIEHGILRKNARNHISPLDKRLIHQVDHLDYRIHFALNCGGQSCPILKEYDDENIDLQLDDAESDFAEGNFIIDHDVKQIQCSPIYKWYQQDFKETYLNDPKYNSYQIRLTDYNWGI